VEKILCYLCCGFICCGIVENKLLFFASLQVEMDHDGINREWHFQAIYDDSVPIDSSHSNSSGLYLMGVRFIIIAGANYPACARYISEGGHSFPKAQAS
jgi:hypothetical protein